MKTLSKRPLNANVSSEHTPHLAGKNYQAQKAYWPALPGVVLAHLETTVSHSWTVDKSRRRVATHSFEKFQEDCPNGLQLQHAAEISGAMGQKQPIPGEARSTPSWMRSSPHSRRCHSTMVQRGSAPKSDAIWSVVATRLARMIYASLPSHFSTP